MPFIASVPGVCRRIFSILLVIFAVWGLSATRADAAYKVLLKVGDTTATNGQLNSVVSVFMQAFTDTVAGYKIYLQLDNPDIMKFQGDSATSIDTTYWDCTAMAGGHCTESTLTIPTASWDFRHIDTNTILIGNYDTTGTLSGGWEYITSRSLAGTGYDILLIGISDDPFNNCSNNPAPPCDDSVKIKARWIKPSSPNKPLLKLLADAKQLCDTTLTGDDRKTNIIIQTSFIGNFGISKPNGNAVGISYEHYLDTNYYVCDQWAGSVCIGGWSRTSTPPYDSIAIRPDSLGYVDTSKVLIDNGSLSILPGACYVCGDINNNSSHNVTIQDVTYLVKFLFVNGPPIPSPVQRANVNCSANPNPTIQDLTYLINFLFNHGPEPCHNCH